MAWMFYTESERHRRGSAYLARRGVQDVGLLERHTGRFDVGDAHDQRNSLVDWLSGGAAGCQPAPSRGKDGRRKREPSASSCTPASRARLTQATFHLTQGDPQPPIHHIGGPTI